MNDDHDHIADNADAGIERAPLSKQLQRLQLPYIRTHYHELAGSEVFDQAAEAG